MNYGDMARDGTDIRALDRLYERCGFDIHAGVITYNSRLPQYRIPDGVLSQRDRALFFDSLTFGFAVANDKKGTDKQEIAEVFVPFFVPMCKEIITRGVNDTKHNFLTEKEAKDLLAKIDNELGWNEKIDTKTNTKLRKSFVGTVASQVPEEDENTYGYLSFHLLSRDGFPVAIQAVVTFQSVSDKYIDSPQFSGYTADCKLFDIVTTDHTSELEDTSEDSLYKNTFFGERCLKQTWAEPKNEYVFIGLLGSFCKACRDVAMDLQKKKDVHRPCIYGNEFVRCPSTFCFDTDRMNILCRWLFHPAMRCKAMKKAPKK